MLDNAIRVETAEVTAITSDYLWPEGNMAKITNYTGNQGSYQDSPSFRPYMNYFPVAEGMTVKGTVRFVRRHAADYGINSNDIASVGFSAGGILCGDEALNFDELVNGTALTSDYRPDALDEVSANVCTIGMIYAFYGRLSVASTDVEKFRASKIPPTFFAYGTRDPFYRQFQACANAVREAGVEIEEHEYEGMPHGFGYTHEEWMISFDRWMTEIMSNN